MDFHKVPIGFGMALAQNEAAMIRFGQLSDRQKKNLLNRARCAGSNEEMYSLVANLANGTW